MVDTLDLRIFKTLISNKIDALTFAYTYNFDLFHEKLFAKLILSYMKAFRDIPTRRTLTEWTGGSNTQYIESVWDQLDRFKYDTHEYSFDLEQLKKRYVAESLLKIQSYVSTSDTSDPDRAVRDISLTIQTVKIVQQGRAFTQETVSEHFDEFEERYKAKSQDSTQSDHILTHYSAMDQANGGFRPAEFFIIGGETGAGKSMMLMNTAIQMWMQTNTIYGATSEFSKGYNITYFSLEMPYDDCYTRFLARMAQVNEKSIIDATLTTEELDRINSVKRFIKAYPYQFDIVDVPRGVTIDEIELRYSDARLKYEPHVVIVDYMGLMHSPEHSKEPDWLKMGSIGGELHEFGRTYNVVMGSAVQLTDIMRNSKTDVKDKPEGQRVGGHRIGRSSQILHHANLGVQIETRMNEHKFGDFKYHIIKNRRGPKLQGTLNKNLEMCSLTDRPYDNLPIDDNKGVDISMQLENARQMSASDIARSNVAKRYGEQSGEQND